MSGKDTHRVSDARSETEEQRKCSLCACLYEVTVVQLGHSKPWSFAFDSFYDSQL